MNKEISERNKKECCNFSKSKEGGKGEKEDILVV